MVQSFGLSLQHTVMCEMRYSIQRTLTLSQLHVLRFRYGKTFTVKLDGITPSYIQCIYIITVRALVHSDIKSFLRPTAIIPQLVGAMVVLLLWLFCGSSIRSAR